MPQDPKGAALAPPHAVQLDEALLTLKTVRQHTAFSSATIYRKIAAGEFPKPLKFGARCSRWRASELSAWIKSLEASA